MTDGPAPFGGQRANWPPGETATHPAVPPAPTGQAGPTPAQQAPQQAPERTLPPPPPEPEPSGPGLAERLQSRLAKARQEHKDNAAAPMGQPAVAPAPTRPEPQRARTDSRSDQARPPQQQRRTSSQRPARKPARRARLRLTRVDPWSVMKTAFLLSIAFGVVTVVSVLMVWSVLGAAGVWDSINATVQNVLGEDSATQFDVENYLGTSRILGFTLLVSVIDVVLLTAIATLGAFLYNMAAALLGGIEVTLAEEGR
jgi:hypothetical protein